MAMAQIKAGADAWGLVQTVAKLRRMQGLRSTKYQQAKSINKRHTAVALQERREYWVQARFTENAEARIVPCGMVHRKRGGPNAP